jgi:pyruvate dehydrogenase E1 component alpha subunit
MNSICFKGKIFWPWKLEYACVTSDGMGTAEWRSAKSPEYYKRGDYVPGMKVTPYLI